jgi:C-terminal processing protease CtpA/Prc
LLKGHRILAIDGEQVNGPNQARQALAGPIGSVVMLEVEYKGERFTVVVQREKSR